MHHQFWVTKKAVQRKLGSKEDQCVVSSDSELDLKIELFDSISATSQDLARILDQYQERMSNLSMEETQLGKFLKEHGKLSQTSGKRMATAGKSISYSGQQRMAVRAPIIRLYSELDTYRSMAVADTQATINSMEKERTEYRAGLSWMKNITLDPENDRGIEKFRKAQQSVRSSKERFDRRSLDCLEKIDLLAASRSNIFSHVLVAYQTAMQVFAQKTFETFKVASKILENEPHYAFTILRDLTQAEKQPKVEEEEKNTVGTESKIPEMRENAIDHDQLLFFQDDYRDDEEDEKDKDKKKQEMRKVVSEEPKPAVVAQIETESLISIDQENSKSETKKLPPSQSSILDALDDDQSDSFLFGDANLETPQGSADLLLDIAAPSAASSVAVQNDPLLDLLTDNSGPIGKSMFSAFSSKLSVLDSKLKGTAKSSTTAADQQPIETNKSKEKTKDMSSWFQLFSELDPLANPDAMSKQIDSLSSQKL